MMEHFYENIRICKTGCLSLILSLFCIISFMQSRNERQFAASFNFNCNHRLHLLLTISKDHLDNSNVNRPLAEKADNVLTKLWKLAI